MLGKLLKYEIKSIGRLLGLVYLAVVAVAIVTGAVGRFADSKIDNPVAFTILLIIYGLLIVGMVIVTILMIIERFYKSMLQGEGYLMHTLPVPTWMHVASKTISALVWEVLSVAVLLISIILCFVSGGVGKEVWKVFEMPELWEIIKENADMAAIIIICVIVQLVRIVLMFYASMAIGGSAARHKIFFSLLSFIVIIIAVNVISVVCNMGVFVNLLIDSSGKNADEWVMGLFVKQLVMDLIYSAAFFGITQFFLKRKLNLE